jgi:outer membrane protein assembly factor BamD (BamD/ComL family)
MKQFLIASIVVVIVIGFSLLIIPRKAELGLMYKKGRQYELAKYEFKKQSHKGDLSTKVTIPLMELFLHFGEIDQAIDLIERFVAKNPKDTLARELLGNLYRDGMKPQKYILNLEKTALLEPTEKSLRELIYLHQTQGQPEKALEFLKTVIQRFPATSIDYFTLAFLQAKNGNLSDALHTLERFEGEHPQSVSINMKELEVHLLIDLGQIDKIHKRASNWLVKNFSFSSLTRLVQLFRSKKQSLSALQLMKTFDSSFKKTPQVTPRSPDSKIIKIPNGVLSPKREKSFANTELVRLLRNEYIDLQFQNLTKREALAKMNELSKGEGLPDSLMEEYIDLALELKEYSLLFDMVMKSSPENVNKNLLLVLSEVTLSAKVNDSMEDVLEKFGDEFLSPRPLLAARLMDHLSDRESTFRWLKKVEAQPDLTLDQQIELIHFYNKLGMPERAKIKNGTLAEMNELSKGEGLPDSLMEEYIDLALELKEYSLLFDMVLKSSPENVNKGLLLALSELYPSAKVNDSMGDVLEKFGDEFLSPRPLLATRLMIRLNDRESSIRWLKKVEAQPNLTLDQQIELIHFYNKLGVPERAKTKIDTNRLQTLIMQKLGKPDTSPSQKKDLVHVLIGFGVLEPALPHLKILAETEGGDWNFNYVKALKDLNRTKQLVGFWEDQVKIGQLTLDEKRSIVFQQLEKNLKSDAEKLLKALAENASPESPDVRQLLFLWGPSVSPENLKWLISQAKASQKKDLAGWMKHLLQVGATQNAIDIAKTADLSNKALFDSYLQALQAVGNKEIINKEILERLITEKNRNHLIRFGNLAESLELNETSLIAFEKVLDINPGDNKTIKKLGLASFHQKNWSKAEYYLRKYLDSSKDDWKTTFYYAETMLSRGKISKAKNYYLHILTQTKTASKNSFDIELTRSTCLHRLGRKKEALLAYQNLLNKYPDNKNSRANFIAALIDFREFDQAQALLDTQ